MFARVNRSTTPVRGLDSRWNIARLRQEPDPELRRDLGVVSIRNLSSSSRSYVGLSGFGIELVSDEPLEG